MAELKTKQTCEDVGEFINQFADSGQKRQDRYQHIENGIFLIGEKRPGMNIQTRITTA
jgi:hypothetical protein